MDKITMKKTKFLMAAAFTLLGCVAHPNPKIPLCLK